VPSCLTGALWARCLRSGALGKRYDGRDGRGPCLGYESVESISDRLVALLGGVLVDQCRSRAGMTEACHQLPRGRPRPGCRRPGEVAKVMEVKSVESNGLSCSAPQRGGGPQRRSPSQAHRC